MTLYTWAEVAKMEARYDVGNKTTIGVRESRYHNDLSPKYLAVEVLGFEQIEDQYQKLTTDQGIFQRAECFWLGSAYGWYRIEEEDGRK